MNFKSLLLKPLLDPYFQKIAEKSKQGKINKVHLLIRKNEPDFIDITVFTLKGEYSFKDEADAMTKNLFSKMLNEVENSDAAIFVYTHEPFTLFYKIFDINKQILKSKKF